VGPEPLAATSAIGVDGQTISLIANNGVVETFDAEVAAQLESSPQLMRVA
jgi:hypothetical protein